MKRKRPQPAALKAYWDKRRGKRAKAKGRRPASSRRPKLLGKVTVVESRTVRRSNPRGDELAVLYAVKGSHLLKYLGNNKFAKKGRPLFFRSVGLARAEARMMRSRYPAALRGFTFYTEHALVR